MARKNIPDKQGRFFRAVFFGLCVLVFVLSGALNVTAQTMREVVGINFGRIALTDNSQSYVMSIDRLGAITKDSAIAIIEAGSPAEYALEGYPPNTLLNISVTTPSTTTALGVVCCPTTDTMVINGFDYPVTVVTDALGTAVLNIGAVLTTGNGGVYVDGVYYINMIVTVSY